MRTKTAHFITIYFRELISPWTDIGNFTGQASSNSENELCDMLNNVNNRLKHGGINKIC